jgi:hypothetical protein
MEAGTDFVQAKEAFGVHGDLEPPVCALHRALSVDVFVLPLFRGESYLRNGR